MILGVALFIMVLVLMVLTRSELVLSVVLSVLWSLTDVTVNLVLAVEAARVAVVAAARVVAVEAARVVAVEAARVALVAVEACVALVAVEAARVVVVEAARVAMVAVEAARVTLVAVAAARGVVDDTYEVCARVVGALLASFTVAETSVLLAATSACVQSNWYAAPPFLTCDGFEHSLLMRPQSFDTL